MTERRSDEDGEKIRIFLNTNITMSRGKAAAHAVHAALTASGVHPGLPVIVLGAKPRDIEAMATSIHDQGRTELEPGTLTAGTDWKPNPVTQPGRYDLARAIAFERLNPTGEYDGAPERLDFEIANAVLALLMGGEKTDD